MVGAQGNPAHIARLLRALPTLKNARGQRALLEGLGQGMQNTPRPLSSVWDNPPADWREAVRAALIIFQEAAQTANDGTQSVAQRQEAVQLLAFAPYRNAREPLQGLLTAQTPVELQIAAVRALSTFSDATVAAGLLAPWNAYSPAVRGEALEALLARPERVTQLLDALAAKKVAPAHLDSTRADRLRKHADATIRQRATTLLAAQVAGDRKTVIDTYRPALERKADAERGRAVFRKNCVACHRLENVGVEVGADLNAALRNKTKEALLIDILDPNREVDARFVNYQVTTTAARTITGILAVETPTSITLRRGEKLEDTILRTQIDEIRATNKSLMPEEFEKQLDLQQFADLLEYLLSQR
jgi:putative heme-binding domain-containing protein